MINLLVEHFHESNTEGLVLVSGQTQVIKGSFEDALKSCRAALDTRSPLVAEPIITMRSGINETHDPDAMVCISTFCLMSREP